MPNSHALRRIDHLVIAAQDLDALADVFRRLGFVVGARNRHPWGTLNHIVQFEDTFIELLGADAAFHVAPDADPHSFSFAGFAASYLEHRQGGAMLALTSDNAGADSRAFAARGFGQFEPFHFDRRAKRADGAMAQVAFTLAFARSPLLPETAFFTCQHHFPENFWNLAFRDHANGATGLSSVVMTAENPAEHGAFLSKFTGVSAYTASSLGIAFELGSRGDQKLEVLTPLAFGQKFGIAALGPDVAPAGISACCIACSDMDALEAALAGGRIVFERHREQIVLPPSVCFGISLIFHEV